MKTIISVLPLAITMMAGPQIIAAIILITGKDAVRSSLAYIAAVFSATIIGTLGLSVFFSLIGLSSLPKNNKGNPISNSIETILIVFLIFLSTKTFRNRANVKLPKWMNNLQETNPLGAFKTGLLVIFFMPSDVMIMITVAMHLISRQVSPLTVIPFALTTIFIASIPLLTYLLFYKKAIQIMPKVRLWANQNSWLIQIIVYLIFIILIWK